MKSSDERNGSMATDKAATALVVMGLLIGAFSLGIYAGNPDLFTKAVPSAPAAQGAVTRHFTLVIEAADIQVSPNATWHAWTYNGTVPGPTLHMRVGDWVSVRVINKLNLTHSFHMHFYNYNFSIDGTPANTIAGVGAASMIPPGGEYTHVFQATDAGLFYYHCHSADQFPVMYHMHQGLYGVIIVDDVSTPHLDHDWPIMMGEIGPRVSGSPAPVYIMDGMGFLGGEGGLQTLFGAKGLPGVQAEMNKTLITFSMKVGETARLDLINIGDQVHTFHLHNMKMVSEWWNPGRAWPAQIVPLDPGVAEAVLITPTQPGIWLFHCHVIGHEDVSMVGLLIVTK